jgi:hypothetical protein
MTEKVTKCPECHLDLNIKITPGQAVCKFECPRCKTKLLHAAGKTEVSECANNKVDGRKIEKRSFGFWFAMAAGVFFCILYLIPNQDDSDFSPKTIELDSVRYEEHERLQRSMLIFPDLSDIVAREISGSTDGYTSLQLDQLWESEFEGKGAWGIGTVVDVREGLVAKHVVRVMYDTEEIELLPREDYEGSLLLNLNRGQSIRFRGVFYRRGSLVKIILSEAYLDK